MALTRQQVTKAFYDIIEKYGKPTSGEIYCETQLIAKIASTLCAYDEVNISFEYGRFEVSPDLCITAKYASDHTFIGTVLQKDWYTSEQIKVMHEIAFGYQF